MPTDPFDIVGKLIGGKYQVESAVQEGTFGIVYRAEHVIWHRPVALKVFRALNGIASPQREQLLADFIREGALLSELSGRSPTIVQARDVGTFVGPDGELVSFIVLEWLEGNVLEEILTIERLPPAAPGWSLDRALRVIEPLAEALSLVHSRGIVHRDIKPGNIFIVGQVDGDDMFIKLLDFGIAKVVSVAAQQGFQKTGGWMTSFTPAYGAPEQFTRSVGATGPWTDVYALALVFIELLAGRPPVEGDDVIQLGMAAADPDRRPTPRALGIEVTDELEAVMQKALAVKPEDRFASASEFWRALRTALDIGPSRWEEGGRVSTRPGRPAETALSTLRASAMVSSQPPSRPPPLPAHTFPPSVEPEPRKWTARRTAVWVAVGCLAATTSLAWIRQSRVTPGGAAAIAYERVAGAAPPTAGSSPASTLAPMEPDALASVSTPKVAGPACPADMATVDGGEFSMGTSDKEASKDEKPSHLVTLWPYCIDRREVTVALYKRCYDDGWCQRPPFEVQWKGISNQERKVFSEACNGDDPERAQHPVNCVSWEMAVSYCEFVGRRLPTEAEWELAARGPASRKYPWGDDPPDATRMNACGRECAAWGAKRGVEMKPLYAQDDGYPTTAPVGSFPGGRSVYGLLDVVGNVGEWVRDWDGPYPREAQRDPSGPDLGTRRVVRGGAFNGSSASWLRLTQRYSDYPDTRSHVYGFRCAKNQSR